MSSWYANTQLDNEPDLVMAVIHMNISQVKTLLNNKTDVNKKSLRWKKTPLELAKIFKRVLSLNNELLSHVVYNKDEQINRTDQIISLLENYKKTGGGLDLTIHPTNPVQRQRDQEVSDFFICPISLERFRDPVIAEDGRTYDRNSIGNYFKTQPDYTRPDDSIMRGFVKSPLTNQPIKRGFVIPHMMIRNILENL